MTRLKWIDWMKCIGMYLIILGHFFSIGYRYVYVFSVPLFFLISGFLSKHEITKSFFWRKLWHNLIIPTIIICVINVVIIPLIFSSYQHIDLSSSNIRRLLIYPIIGMQNILDTCWFVYTLIILKIIHQYTKKLWWRLCITVPFLVCSYFYNHIDMTVLHPLLNNPNAIANVFVAYPFFVLGDSLQQYKQLLNDYHNKIIIVTCLAICLLIVYYCGINNDCVWMYKGAYGDNILLFLIGGVAGSAAIFFIAKSISSCPNAIITISKGTIIILGFNKHFVSLFQHLIQIPKILDYISALLILILFIPIIKVTEKRFPIILGKNRINK